MNVDLMRPKLSDRPHGARVARVMRARAADIYRSFTTGWEAWFALPDTLLANPMPQGQLFFVVEHENRKHPHYGRFLVLEPDRRAEMTWLTGVGGTQGAETVLSIELNPTENGCELILEHRGFYDQRGADLHGTSWERILADLDRRLAGGP